MKKVAVILSGCGTRDGSEIHESTLSLLALAKYGIEYQCFALDKAQTEVVNHYSLQQENEQRNMLVEAARIARCEIKSVAELKVADFDALWLPGGLGAAKNLCSFFYEGVNMNVDADIEQVIRAFALVRKPIVALCIAPVILAKVLGATVTSGKDENTAKKITAMGGKNVVCNYDEIAFDSEKLVISAPCYMLDANIWQIWQGIEKAAGKLAEIL